ncbi:hypothetical protein BO71DRAFT_337711, partial [Aspergillus ellipticus CBS 707.79]
YPDSILFNREDLYKYYSFLINFYIKFLIKRNIFSSKNIKVLYTYSRLKEKTS